MEGFIRLVAPGIGADVDAIEQAMLGIGDGEVGTEKLGAGAEIDEAAGGVGVAGDIGAPAIPQIDGAAEPGFARWYRRFGWFGIGGWFRVRGRRCGWLRRRRVLGEQRERAGESEQGSHLSRFRSM